MSSQTGRITCHTQCSLVSLRGDYAFCKELRSWPYRESPRDWQDLTAETQRTVVKKVFYLVRRLLVKLTHLWGLSTSSKTINHNQGGKIGKKNLWLILTILAFITLIISIWISYHSEKTEYAWIIGSMLFGIGCGSHYKKERIEDEH